jgi:hypothetical protein
MVSLSNQGLRELQQQLRLAAKQSNRMGLAVKLVLGRWHYLSEPRFEVRSDFWLSLAKFINFLDVLNQLRPRILAGVSRENVTHAEKNSSGFVFYIKQKNLGKGYPVEVLFDLIWWREVDLNH